jgi:hypothetical protein
VWGGRSHPLNVTADGTARTLRQRGHGCAYASLPIEHPASNKQQKVDSSRGCTPLSHTWQAGRQASSFQRAVRKTLGVHTTAKCMAAYQGQPTKGKDRMEGIQ